MKTLITTAKQVNDFFDAKQSRSDDRERARQEAIADAAAAEDEQRRADAVTAARDAMIARSRAAHPLNAQYDNQIPFSEIKGDRATIPAAKALHDVRGQTTWMSDERLAHEVETETRADTVNPRQAMLDRLREAPAKPAQRSDSKKKPIDREALLRQLAEAVASKRKLKRK